MKIAAFDLGQTSTNIGLVNTDDNYQVSYTHNVPSEPPRFEQLIRDHVLSWRERGENLEGVVLANTHGVKTDQSAVFNVKSKEIYVDCRALRRELGVDVRLYNDAEVESMSRNIQSIESEYWQEGGTQEVRERDGFHLYLGTGLMCIKTTPSQNGEIFIPQLTLTRNNSLPAEIVLNKNYEKMIEAVADLHGVKKEGLRWKHLLSGSGLENLYHAYFGEEKNAREIIQEKKEEFASLYTKLLGTALRNFYNNQSLATTLFVEGSFSRIVSDLIDQDLLKKTFILGTHDSERYRKVPIIHTSDPQANLKGAAAGFKHQIQTTAGLK